MEPVELEKLIPMNSSVKIGDKEYELRKFNLLDEVWAVEKFSSNMQENLKKIDVVAKIAFRLMKDKTDFLPSEEDVENDDGQVVLKKMEGWQKILMKMSGAQEKIDFMWAVYKTLGISRPEPEESTKESAEKNG